jgi:hypothetical protein
LKSGTGTCALAPNATKSATTANNTFFICLLFLGD